jgi:hypothetical protein
MRKISSGDGDGSPRWYFGRALAELRSPVLVFLILTQMLLLAAVYLSVQERRQLDAQIMLKLLEKCELR